MRVYCLVALIFIGAASAKEAPAQSYDFTPIDYPGTSYTKPWGINDSGQIVGACCTTGSSFSGFLYSATSYSLVNFPSSFPSNSAAAGINNAGNIVGTYEYLSSCSSPPYPCFAETGFIFTGNNFEAFNYPNSFNTWLNGINNKSDLVGYYQSTFPALTLRGFSVIGGQPTSFDAPQALGQTAAYGINDQGDIVGSYFGRTGAF
jgi:uncharacterized membrane protein